MTRRALLDAAFGSSPGGPVPAAVDPAGRWLRAVALGGQGRYAAAATELAALLVDPGVPVTVAAHAAVTRASHLRQMGGHAAARSLDAMGLRLAEGALRSGAAGSDAPPDPIGELTADGGDAAAARIDALVGLAADAIGTGDAAGARRLLAAAADTAGAHRSWRPRVRWGWVHAELALVEGRAADAVVSAEGALAASTAAGSCCGPSRRHALKSRIVLAVAQASAGVLDPDAAVARLDALEACAALHGLLPLRWPAALAAADLAARASGTPSRDLSGSSCDTPCDTPQHPVTGSCAKRVRGVTRRRHAAAAALGVVEERADPLGRRVMRESPWVPGGSHGNVITPFGATSPT